MNDIYPIIEARNGRLLAVVGGYATRSDAYDRALVVASMELPHWVLGHGEGFALCVRPDDAEAVVAELARFETERVETPPAPAAAPAGPAPRFSLFLAGWVMAGFGLAQLLGGARWEDRGTASSLEIMRGQWWRCLTALTLHAEAGHLIANMAVGLIYAFFLLPLMGAGWTWFCIVLAGGLGNWLNAWGHRDIEHLSIGASTAVFGALGMLVAAQCALRALDARRVRARDFLAPVGAGLGLLAWLGVGGQQTDYMAHCLGFLAGMPLGAAGICLRLRERTGRAGQAALGVAAVAMLVGAWRLAR